jgi:hypothetical protein
MDELTEQELNNFHSNQLLNDYMKDSAKYYANNPEARKKKLAYDKEFQKAPDQVKKRVALNKYNKDHGSKGDGLDAFHKGGKIVGTKKASANRGSKSDSPGDKRARGSKK